MLNNPKWNEPSLTDFIVWLGSKDPDESYNFNDCTGECLMGQYMQTKGVMWKSGRYTEFCHMVLGGGGNQSVLSNSPQTYGAALERAVAWSNGNSDAQSYDEYYGYCA
jgi:hypothetical protein